jgi:hypothetical protein
VGDVVGVGALRGRVFSRSVVEGIFVDGGGIFRETMRVFLIVRWFEHVVSTTNVIGLALQARVQRV